MKNPTTILSSSPTSGYISKGSENKISKRDLLSHIQCSIIYSSQENGNKYPFIDEQIKKMCIYITHRHTHSGILLSLRKEENHVI